MATKAFCSSPVFSLLEESGKPQLSVRQAQLICNYYLALKAKTDLHAHNKVLRQRQIEKYDQRPNALACFAADAGIKLADLRIRHFLVQQYHTPNINP